MPALDIPEKQILLRVEGQPPWSHRILVIRIDGAKWITYDPDGDVEVIDLTDEDIKILNELYDM